MFQASYCFQLVCTLISIRPESQAKEIQLTSFTLYAGSCVPLGDKNVVIIKMAVNFTSFFRNI
jgi:hypothetical protein